MLMVSLFTVLFYLLLLVLYRQQSIATIQAKDCHQILNMKSKELHITIFLGSKGFGFGLKHISYSKYQLFLDKI